MRKPPEFLAFPEKKKVEEKKKDLQEVKWTPFNRGTMRSQLS